MKLKNISRKTFLKQLLTLLLIPLLFLLNELVIRSKKYGLGKKIVEIPADLGIGVSFFQEVIDVKKDSGAIQMFSSKCPHLGCQINKVNDGNITCPCHGSTFNKDGQILKGPASNSLTKLDFSKNENGNFTVELNT